MKRTLLTIMTAATLLFCSCEKDPNDNPGGRNPDEPTIDITPYLGTYLMSRTTDLVLTVATFNIPIDRDLDVETVTVKKDPNKQYGVIMSSTDGMYMYGTVDTLGLHLQNDTIRFATMVHPVISAPVNGKMEWTSTATGTASAMVPLIGQVTGSISGLMHYRTVLR